MIVRNEKDSRERLVAGQILLLLSDPVLRDAEN